MKLFFLLLSFLGFSQNTSTTNDQPDPKSNQIPSPTVYNQPDAGDNERGGWDRN